MTTKRSRFLQTPIEPFVVEAGLTAGQILARMALAARRLPPILAHLIQHRYVE